MKTTIEMAREAWAEAGEGWVADAWFDDRAKAFEAFAKLARADEREGTSMTKYEEQIQGMAKKNRGSVGFQEALAQPEQQEPVAFDVWLQECESMTMAVRHGVKFLLMPEESAVRIGTAIQNTTPLQRKPLTDDELSDIWFKQSTDWMEFARAIEAAHGIKENT